MDVKITGKMVLAVPMHPKRNDAGAASVREYLCALVERCWEEGEGFSGKRPFGNSGWEGELTGALAKAGLCHEDDDRAAREMIMLAIAELREPT